MKTVIICGGIGSKMWPLSRQKMPKQFLPLINGKSVFQLNWETLRFKFDSKDIFLQTNEYQAQIAKKQVPEILDGNIFIEPERRNQGPATGFAAAQLIKRGFGDDPFMLIQADVSREPSDKFLKMIDEAGKLTKETGKYLTGGFVPKTIVAGVDYLVKGNLVTENNGVRIYEVADYIDRKEEEKISQYLGTDKLLLHANHTTMTPNNLLKMYQKYKPEWYQPLVEISKNGDVVIEYAKMPKGSIEEVTKIAYKNNEALVAELPFNWVDLGTWKSLEEYLKKENLYKKDNVLEIEGKNNFVVSKKFTAIIGLSDVEIIETDDALLIVKREKSGKVGEVVDFLKQKNPDLL
jgi:mannose-1-phosphate guanylyltransferase